MSIGRFYAMIGALIHRAEAMRALISDELLAYDRLVEGSSPVSSFDQLYYR